ncbi:MAG: hypothetical protein K2H64_03520 [Desulfovibrio sp.]|nr:hypothetical protein [Desulfovibrio sp.]
MPVLNDITDLQAVDFAFSEVIADCFAACASSGPRAWIRFLGRPNPEKIFYVKNDDIQAAMRKVAKRVDDDGRSGGELPAILYYRDVGLNGDMNQYATIFEATRFVSEDPRGEMDAVMRVTIIPVTLNYSIVFLAWDRPSVERMLIAWQAWIAPLGRKHSRFLVPYTLAGESFEVGASINTPREVAVSSENMGEGIRLWGARASVEINTHRDPFLRFKSELNIKEFDTLTVSFSDPWREDAADEKEKFVILTARPDADSMFRLNCMASRVYAMKVIADKTRVFTRRSMSDILGTYSGGARLDIDRFPVVENYHCVAGERPTKVLRQISTEQGAHIWYARGKFYLRKFSSLWAQAPAFTFQRGSMIGGNRIMSFQKVSGQFAGQENSIRSFSGWDEKNGRVKTSPDMPLLAKAKSKPVAMGGSPNKFVLGTAPVAKKTAIDFITLGNMSVSAGQKLKLVWHSGIPSDPIDESLPDNVVAESVAHWYSSQKFYTRIRGAVALESF